jgi:hypothetical protein
MIFGQSRQRKLIDVHVAGEIVERMRQARLTVSLVIAAEGSATSSTRRHA